MFTFAPFSSTEFVIVKGSRKVTPYSTVPQPVRYLAFYAFKENSSAIVQARRKKSKIMPI